MNRIQRASCAALLLVTTSSGLAQSDPPSMTGLWDRNGNFSLSPGQRSWQTNRLAEHEVYDDPNVWCEGYNVMRHAWSTNTEVKIEELDDRIDVMLIAVDEKAWEWPRISSHTYTRSPYPDSFYPEMYLDGRLPAYWERSDKRF